MGFTASVRLVARRRTRHFMPSSRSQGRPPQARFKSACPHGAPRMGRPDHADDRRISDRWWRRRTAGRHAELAEDRLCECHSKCHSPCRIARPDSKLSQLQSGQSGWARPGSNLTCWSAALRLTKGLPGTLTKSRGTRYAVWHNTLPSEDAAAVFIEASTAVSVAIRVFRDHHQRLGAAVNPTPWPF